MRLSVVLDDAVVRAAKELTDIDDMNESLDEALRALSAREGGKRLAALGGALRRTSERRQPTPRRRRTS